MDYAKASIASLKEFAQENNIQLLGDKRLKSTYIRNFEAWEKKQDRQRHKLQNKSQKLHIKYSNNSLILSGDLPEKSHDKVYRVVARNSKQIRIFEFDLQNPSNKILCESPKFGKKVKTKQATIMAKTLAAELGLPYTNSLRKFKPNKEYKALKKKIDSERRNLIRAKLRQESSVKFEEFARAYFSKEVALAELIKYLNRYAKCYPKYKEATAKNRKTVEIIYKVKDAWLESNANKIVSSVLSLSKKYEFIDWDLFHLERCVNGWADVDDYKTFRSYKLFAYELYVDGVTYRFHSEIKIGKNLSYDPKTQGRAKALTLGEREKLPIKEALCLATSQLLNIDIMLSEKVNEPENAIQGKKQNCYDDYYY